jgi:decaprenyl-phosphate phosphoribosyltransferase
MTSDPQVNPRTEVDPVAAPPAPRPGSGSPVAGLVRLARPKQWLKNILVFVAPGAAGVLLHPGPLLRTLLAFVVFCLAASGTYYINDARDVAADRVHARKRFRPVASGQVSVRTAYTGGVLLIALALGLSMLAGWQLLVTVAAYVGLTTAYSLWLKHEPVVDLVGVAAGFVLRALAGATATHISVSSWFLIVASLGSLFMVAGKREAELRNAGDEVTRSTLQRYSMQFLNYVQAAATGALLVSYCMWAFDVHTGGVRLLFGLSIVPFAVGVLRYAMLVDIGRGEEPEEAVLSDRVLLACGLLLALLLGIGVYVV